MYRIHQVKLSLHEDISSIPMKIKKMTGADVSTWQIAKESIDARDKRQIKKVYTVDFSCGKKLKLEQAPDRTYRYAESGTQLMKHPPVIVGFGPCGLFAALILADMGYCPIVLERGKAMEGRIEDVERFWKTGRLHTESNVQFGEGGAGTFSDGKLTTGIKDPRIRKVLEEFVAAGAEETLLYKQKPHIGTDVLREMIVRMRERIIAQGGEIRFESRVSDLEIEEGSIRSVTVNEKETIPAETLILALGHSARDTFRMLQAKGIPMEQKPFSMGVRIEHLQERINAAQYGNPELAKILGPADYKLNHRCENGRGVYTFCMCPGGEVIMAATQENTVVTNGMSYSSRNGRYANSGLLVDVRTDDFPSDDVLAGVQFQEKYERLAYENGRPPKVQWGSFAEENPVRSSLPAFVSEAIAEAMPHLGKKLKGFDEPQAVLTAVESRSSSPVRILRGEDMQSHVSGIYPAGEGAGYAGGIMSAAVDGIRVAENIAARFACYSQDMVTSVRRSVCRCRPDC